MKKKGMVKKSQASEFSTWAESLGGAACTLLLQQLPNQPGLWTFVLRVDLTLPNVLITPPLWLSDQRCGPGALRTPLLSERTKKHQGRSADRRLQPEYHTADTQEGKFTMFECSSFSVLSWHRHGIEAEFCPDVSGAPDSVC